KIQEGCNNHCTYCIIPSVRGGIRSRPLEQVKSEAEALATAGFSELVLTGIHLTSYGRDLPEKPSLMDAIAAVHEVEGVRRIRLGSLEPVVVTEAFAAAASALPKLCPQFHLALQSGSDTVLARMKRRYNTAQYRAAAARLRETYADAALTTDVIVGFPGETEAEFAQTVAFCEEIGFLKIHVFPFSPREGTPAAAMENQVPDTVKTERVHALLALSDRLSAAYRKSLLNTVQPVLLEERGAGGRLRGYTPQYVPVSCVGGVPGEIVKVRLTGLSKAGMMGERVETMQ
ncbi:MAG: MiaB/RimO family radical SAM methylthiotransferase, partial [Eubacteriales bacterium]|nr:MiaB/RimO family radical SAM methylthiotransferase [Eubacteriales bacterium]